MMARRVKVDTPDAMTEDRARHRIHWLVVASMGLEFDPPSDEAEAEGRLVAAESKRLRDSGVGAVEHLELLESYMRDRGIEHGIAVADHVERWRAEKSRERG